MLNGRFGTLTKNFGALTALGFAGFLSVKATQKMGMVDDTDPAAYRKECIAEIASAKSDINGNVIVSAQEIQDCTDKHVAAAEFSNRMEPYGVGTTTVAMYTGACFAMGFPFKRRREDEPVSSLLTTLRLS